LSRLNEEKTSYAVHLQKEGFTTPNKIRTPHIKQQKCKKQKQKQNKNKKKKNKTKTKQNKKKQTKTKNLHPNALD
jgi:hypothetical protein